MVNENLKQRIVGALVLVALAVIFVPLLFDFSGRQEVDTTSQIPPRPEIQAVEIAEPVRPKDIVPAKSDEDMFQFGVETKVEETSTDKESQPLVKETPAPEKVEMTLKDEKPALSSEGIPVAWVLQIGSFRDKAKAKALLEDLLKDGYKAFIREKKDANGSLSRVFVGPLVLKKKLVQQKSAIDKKYRVDAILVHFEP